MTEIVTPNEIIIDFIKRQPIQTRDSISATILMVTDMSAIMGTTQEEFHKAAFDIIDPDSVGSKVVAAAAAIGIIDYYFSKAPMNSDRLARAAESRGDDLFMDISRRMVLTNAYFERAEEEWKGLRQTALSYQALNFIENAIFSHGLT